MNWVNLISKMIPSASSDRIENIIYKILNCKVRLKVRRERWRLSAGARVSAAAPPDHSGGVRVCPRDAGALRAPRSARCRPARCRLARDTRTDSARAPRS